MHTLTKVHLLRVFFTFKEIIFSSLLVKALTPLIGVPNIILH
jgi:hypothetical protein